MRLYRVVILMNLALGVGILIGYHWSARDLSPPPAPATSGSAAVPAGARSWTVKGIVRGTIPAQNLVVITHEPIPGLMGAMTMGFRAEARLREGLAAGDAVEFTLDERDKELLVVALRKEGAR